MSGKTIQFPFFPASPHGKLLSVKEGVPLKDVMNQLGLVLCALQAQMEEIAANFDKISVTQPVMYGPVYLLEVAQALNEAAQRSMMAAPARH